MKHLFIFMILVAPVFAIGQSKEEKEAILKPVKQLFEAMKKGDSALLRNAFTKEVTLATVAKTKEGKLFFKTESSLNDFAKVIATPHADVYNEVVWDEIIQVDRNFAQVWAPYAFYLGNKFNHCGVDAFQLVKTDAGVWKIFHLADTRQKEGCSVPKKISSQFK